MATEPKREPREWWLVLMDNGDMAGPYTKKAYAVELAEMHGWQVVHVIEVLEKTDDN
jgi:hypothetical protein